MFEENQPTTDDGNGNPEFQQYFSENYDNFSFSEENINNLIDITQETGAGFFNDIGFAEFGYNFWHQTVDYLNAISRADGEVSNINIWDYYNLNQLQSNLYNQNFGNQWDFEWDSVTGTFFSTLVYL